MFAFARVLQSIDEAVFVDDGRSQNTFKFYDPLDIFFL